MGRRAASASRSGGVYVAEKAVAPVHTELADRRKGVPHKHNRLID